MKKKKGNVRFTVTSVILVMLVAVFAWTLKYKERKEEPTPPVEQGNEMNQTAEADPGVQEPQEEEPQEPPAEPEPQPEPVPEPPVQASGDEEIEAQRASFVTDYESAPLLNTTPIKYLTMQQGGSPGEVNFNWFSPSGAKGQVVLYEVSGGDTQTISAQTTASATEAGFYYNKAKVTGLKEKTTYAYKVGNGDGWSPEYQFTTKNFSGDFSFVVTSDAQIGQSQTEDIQTTIDNWDKVVNRITKYMPDAAFLVHLGDQVAGYNDPEHYQGFFDHLGLYTMPLVPIVGNHDVDCWDSGGGPWFYERYYVPNRSNIGCNWADTDGDYWFRYGNVLFMVLNTNTVYPKDCHEEFVRQACGVNPDATWKIILEHYPAYSSVQKYQDMCSGNQGTFAYMAANLGIDLYLSGHDHAYTRTAIMNEACETLGEYDYESGSVAQDPAGTLYVTTGTASGCIYQPVTDNYAAVKQGQPETLTAMRVDVTDTTLKLTTYLMDSWQVYDEYTLQKTSQ